MKQKFELLETEKGHWYRIENQDFPHGIDLPSATNILEAYPNPGLDFWKENTSPEVIKEKQTTGKNSGTKVHHLAFLLSLGETISPEGANDKQIEMLPIKGVDKDLVANLQNPLTDREISCLKGFSNYWEEHRPISIAQELQVYSKKDLFAGTLDWVGYLWNTKLKKYELWIIDYKISKSHCRSYELQISAYDKALREMRGKRTKFKLGVLYVGKPTKKKFQLKEITNGSVAYKSFLLTKKLWEDLYPNASPKIKALVQPFKVEVYKKKGKQLKIN